MTAEPSSAKTKPWTLMTRHGDKHVVVVDHDPEKEEERTVLFRLNHATEAGFVVGAGGRNTALVHKTTGVSVVVVGDEVVGVVRGRTPRLEVARRMALSMSAGGVLRWFITPQATAKGYPDERQAALSEIASARQCDLMLLRSKRGHMCLLLVIQAAHDAADPDAVRGMVRAARDALLLALTH
jgi:hypothetical protein